MTIETIISTVRQIIGQYKDSTVYSDEFLYELLNNTRNTLIRQNYQSFNHASSYDWIHFCMPMCVSTNHVCTDCVPVGCPVLISKYNIPRSIVSRYKDLITVIKLNGEEIGRKTFDDYKQAKQFSNVKSKKLYFDIINEYLYIYGGDTNIISPRVVQIGIIPESIEDLDNIPNCDNSGAESTQSCYDIFSKTFNIEKGFADRMIDIVLQKLDIAIKTPNNAETRAN